MLSIAWCMLQLLGVGEVAKRFMLYSSREFVSKKEGYKTYDEYVKTEHIQINMCIIGR